MKRVRALVLLALLGLVLSGCWDRSASTDGTSRLRDEGQTTSPAGRTRASADSKSYLWADPP